LTQGRAETTAFHDIPHDDVSHRCAELRAELCTDSRERVSNRFSRCQTLQALTTDDHATLARWLKAETI
jgi:hypothetical protein